MTGRLTMLGPQRPRPQLPQVLAGLDRPGPVAVVTAGWRLDERELDALQAAIDRPILHLPLYAWFEELGANDPEITTAWRRRQGAIVAYKRVYREQLRAAELAETRVAAMRDRAPQVIDDELAFSRQVIRNLDARCLRRLDEIRASVPEIASPWELPGARARHEQAKEHLEQSAAVLLAGGHVAVLLNRLLFFGFEVLLKRHLEQGGEVVAWSAGAMVLGEQIVLFNDEPPGGAGGAWMLDRGLGLVSEAVMLPHASDRLHTGDATRMARMAHRFAPQACLALDPGAWIERTDDGFVNRGKSDAAWRVGEDGAAQPLPVAAP